MVGGSFARALSTRFRFIRFCLASPAPGPRPPQNQHAERQPGFKREDPAEGRDLQRADAVRERGEAVVLEVQVRERQAPADPLPRAGTGSPGPRFSLLVLGGFCRELLGRIFSGRTPSPAC